MRIATALISAPALAAAAPALAATGEYGFFSLRNTDFVVLIGFAVFLAIVFYYKVPPRLMGMLDKRADDIRKDLDEARALREEAQTLLASYERKTREARGQADDIVAAAKRDSEVAAEQAKADLQRSVERRMAAAEEQIASAQAAALREVRDRAIQVATAAAAEVMARQMGPAEQGEMIDRAIGQVEAKLH
jgi:F-type H+-transporting ATPase subunit b